MESDLSNHHPSTRKSQMKVDVVAHIHAKPNCEHALREVLESFVAPTRKEEGCIRYDLFCDLDDSTKFTFIEEWASREALEKHGQSAHIAAGRAKFPELLAQPPWVQVVSQIA
jgi:quinol monooxygenase YgiN